MLIATAILTFEMFNSIAMSLLLPFFSNKKHKNKKMTFFAELNATTIEPEIELELETKIEVEIETEKETESELETETEFPIAGSRKEELLVVDRELPILPPTENVKSNNSLKLPNCSFKNCITFF
jgi:hypothetical protein